MLFSWQGGESGKKDSWHNILEIGSECFSNTITSVQKDNYVLETTNILARKDMEKRG